MRLELHLPISRQEAKKRGLGEDVSKLLVQFEDRENSHIRVSETIHLAKGDSPFIIAQSINCFLNPKKVKAILESRKLHYKFDSEVNKKLKKEHEVLVSCFSLEGITNAIQYIESEAMVFYVLEQDDLLGELVCAGREGYMESNFLSYLDTIPYFLFYSSTHKSVEILGRRKAVKAMFLANEKHWSGSE